jgi:hypothetical protein
MHYFNANESVHFPGKFLEYHFKLKAPSLCDTKKARVFQNTVEHRLPGMPGT